ncbi:MAG: hypothetical protein RSC36_06505, partial [Ruthenibacterium sp.]
MDFSATQDRFFALSGSFDSSFTQNAPTAHLADVFASHLLFNRISTTIQRAFQGIGAVLFISAAAFTSCAFFTRRIVQIVGNKFQLLLQRVFQLIDGV